MKINFTTPKMYNSTLKNRGAINFKHENEKEITLISDNTPDGYIKLKNKKVCIMRRSDNPLNGIIQLENCDVQLQGNTLVNKLALINCPKVVLQGNCHVKVLSAQDSAVEMKKQSRVDKFLSECTFVNLYNNSSIGYLKHDSYKETSRFLSLEGSSSIKNADVIRGAMGLKHESKIEELNYLESKIGSITIENDAEILKAKVHSNTRICAPLKKYEHWYIVTGK